MLLLLLVSSGAICILYFIEMLSACVAMWLFDFCYPPKIKPLKQISHQYAFNDKLVSYLQNFNPLANYYDDLPMTMGDKLFINKILNNTQAPIVVDDLSGMMLLKIYFSRELFIKILTNAEYAILISAASKMYKLYTDAYPKYKDRLFIPNMFGYHDPNKIDVFKINEETIQWNRLFYFSKYSDINVN